MAFFYDTPEDTTTSNVKIRRVSKDNFKHDKCFTCDQKGKKIIWSKRRSISSRNRRWTCHFNRSNNSLWKFKWTVVTNCSKMLESTNKWFRYVSCRSYLSHSLGGNLQGVKNKNFFYFSKKSFPHKKSLILWDDCWSSRKIIKSLKL